MYNKIKNTVLPALVSIGAYSATYDSNDIDDIVIDFVGTYIVQLVAFAGLIALLVVAVWFMKRGRGIGVGPLTGK